MTLFSRPPSQLSSKQVSRQIAMSARGSAAEENLGLETVTIDVEGMMCAGCVSAVSRTLKKQFGVQDAVVNLITEVATVKAESSVDGETLAQALTNAGFPSTNRQVLQGKRRTEQLAELNDRRAAQASKQKQKLAIALFLVVLSSAGHIGHAIGHPLPGLGNDEFHAVLAGLALFGPGREILVEGLKGLARNSPNMNTLIALGSLLAFGSSVVALLNPAIGWECFFDEPVMLIGFILLGRALEQWAKREALSSFQALLALQPKTAHLLSKTQPDSSVLNTIDIPVEHLRQGEWVQILPGEQVPIDGTVLSGTSAVDESMLTGEALPLEKSKGDRLSAGTLNRSGVLTVEVTQVGTATNLAKIIQFVEDAQTRRAPVQQLADTIAGYFTYGVLTLSAMTFLGWYTFGQEILVRSAHAIASAHGLSAHSMASHGTVSHGLMPQPSPLLLSLKLAISLMVVACPCALGLATPTALIVGSSLGAQRGLLIRGGDVLQRVGTLDTIVFDKTGTLTIGRPTVVDVIPVKEEGDLIQLAATAEIGTHHPLALAILQAAQDRSIDPLPHHDSQTIPGCGVSTQTSLGTIRLGTLNWLMDCDITVPPKSIQQADDFACLGKTVVFLALNSHYRGLLTISDAIRPEVIETLLKLQQQGFQVKLLTGDRLSTAQALAQQAGIPREHVIAGVLPTQKAEAIARLQAQGHHVAMVGDGINDAPALAQADVGIAMKGGTEVASETAGIVLMRDRISDVLLALDLSQATLSTIYINLAWAFAYNLLALPIAAGILLPTFNFVLTPGQAGILMAVSSITVIGNSILLRWRTNPEKIIFRDA